MEKEKILEASRKDNKNKDVAKIENENKAVKFAAIGIVLLSTIYFTMDIFIKGKTNYGFYSIIALYNSIFYGYTAIKTKKKINIINALIWTVLAIMLIIVYIKNIFETSEIM